MQEEEYTHNRLRHVAVTSSVVSDGSLKIRCKATNHSYSRTDILPLLFLIHQGTLPIHSNLVNSPLHWVVGLLDILIAVEIEIAIRQRVTRAVVQ